VSNQRLLTNNRLKIMGRFFAVKINQNQKRGLAKSQKENFRLSASKKP
jgi:hypothetical protein